MFPLDPASPELRTMVDKDVQRNNFITMLTGALGSKFLLIWQPMRWTEGCAVSAAVAEGEKTLLINPDQLNIMRNNFTITYAAIADRLSEKPYYTSFSNVLCIRSVPFNRPDGVPLNDDGRRAVAKAMSQLLLERFFSRGQ